ncbi:uncharacterized protein JCM10292_002788 [Rhodotorula paludigena]|uniref:uncharacterized protein n=1 Tax=Rhodotorula paludigena TaxID=86838 RepID=UPI00317DE676
MAQPSGPVHAVAPSAAPAAAGFPAPPPRPAPPPASARLVAAPPEPKPAPAHKAHYFHYGTRSVKARIDPEVPLDEVLRQLCASSQLQVAEPATLFALRDKDSGALVTQDNMRAMLEKATTFTLVSSPMLEAVEMVDKLSSGEASVLKLATFSLRSLIKERAFLAEFIARGGVDALQEVIRRSSGNTLAYALLSLQNLLELEESGWVGLERSFVARIVDIIATEPLINISRPATAILRRLASQPLAASSASTSTSPRPTSASASGFLAVFEAVLAQPNFLPIVIERLSGGDVPVTNLSLGLINSLLRGSNELGDLRLVDEVENLDAWKTVGKLLDGSKGADLSTILTLQSNLVASLHLALTTPIDEEHYPYFDQLWIASRLTDTDESNRWRRLGFRTESPQYEFGQAGLLGLKALKRYAEDSQNEFAQTLADQASRPEARRCPVSTISNVVLCLLADHFGLTSGLPSTPATPSPYLFRFYELHALVVTFFLRMWTESGASAHEPGDLERVSALARSQIAFVLGGGGDKTWFAVRREFLSAEYRQVRERQVREMEIEDDLLSKAPVRNLRGRLYLESYEFVRSQRISCLHEGAWFQASQPASSGGSTGRKGAQSRGAQSSTWRFYRLAANRKALHWVEASEKREIRSGLDDLPDKIDLNSITDVIASGVHTLQRPRLSQVAGLNRVPSSASGATAAAAHASRLSFLSKDSGLPGFRSATPPSSSPQSLTFTLVTSDGPLVELTAPSSATYSEWVDGLSLLRPEEGSISTRDTADYIQALTDVGVKVKLLDLSGERVEILPALEVDQVPASTNFFYSDSL